MMKKGLPEYFKINVIVILLCAITVLGLSVGYSILSSQVDINTNILLASENNIRISNISDMTSVSSAYEVNNVTFTNNSITTSVGLPNLDSSISYSVTINNTTDTPKEVSNITYTTNNDNFIYKLSDMNKGSTIASKKSVTFLLTIKYNDKVISIPDSVEGNNLIEFTFIDYVEKDPTYISDDIILNLSGEDAPIDNNWVDRVNGNKISLNNVSYNSIDLNYNFSSGGYGKASIPMIPETGDFTIETVITLPEKLATSDDQAIISQISDTSNSSGRFKINYQFKSPNYSVLIFSNETSTNTNSFNYFYNYVTASTKYFLQAVRSGNKLNLYLNGFLIQSYNYAINNKIGQQPLKIARWNNSNPQSFKGSISAIRIYSRALSADEIYNNYLIDKKKYLPEDNDNSPHSIKDFVLSNYLVNYGDGLYDEGNGIYRFKGNSLNNYVMFDGDLDLYRIISIDSDDNMRLINVSENINIPFDESGNRTFSGTNASSYCDSAEVIAEANSPTQMYKGCNAFSSNGTTIMNDASSNTYLNTTFYNSLSSNVRNLLKMQNTACGRVPTSVSIDELITKINDTICTSRINFLTLEEILKSPVNVINSLNEKSTGSSYIFSLPSSTMAIWTMNGSTENSFDIWSLTQSAGMAKRRSSRYSQSPIYFYAYPVISVSSLIEVTGNGSIKSPFLFSF